MTAVTRSRGKHRAAPRKGPVTLAFSVATAKPNRAGSLALRAWPAVPALFLIRPALAGSPMLPGYAGDVLGLDASLAIVACLAVTPVLTAVKLRISALRWWYGIWVFVLGAAGLLITLAAPGPGGYEARAAGSAVNWTGLVLVVLLLPMAATSNSAAQKLLGPEWKRWQRYLVWAVWFITLDHMMLMHAALSAGAFAAATLPLILLRYSPVRRAVRKWRAGGYATGGMWFLLTVCCIVVAAGLAVLLAREGLFADRAVTLAP